MIHPASDKILALSVVAGEPLVQGNVLRFIDNGDGRMKALGANAAANVDFGVFLAYQVPPDSEDVTFQGAPESTTFTLNTDTGVGGGTHDIASGSELVALGGSKTALIRMDRFSMSGTPADLTAFAPGDVLDVESSDSRLHTSAGDLNVNGGLVVQHDTVTMVVLLG